MRISRALDLETAGVDASSGEAVTHSSDAMIRELTANLHLKRILLQLIASNTVTAFSRLKKDARAWGGGGGGLGGGGG